MSKPPVRELVNVLEVGEVARAQLAPVLFASLSGGDRAAFDRITFRPRLMMDVTKLDLSVELFGQTLATPIIVGPVAQQQRFHPEGEVAMARGAAAAKALMIAPAQSSLPLERVQAEAKEGCWVQVEPGSPAQGQVAVMHTAGHDWAAIDRFRRGLKTPLVLKGIVSAAEARAAAERGVQGIIVSSYGVAGAAHSLEALPAIADAVGGRIPILIDGGFRRGTDIAKALALGASAVVIARPAVWGLAAYGAEGVQHVVELLQSELARAVAMLGKVNAKQLGRDAIRVHRW